MTALFRSETRTSPERTENLPRRGNWCGRPRSIPGDGLEDRFQLRLRYLRVEIVLRSDRFERKAPGIKQLIAFSKETPRSVEDILVFSNCMMNPCPFLSRLPVNLWNNAASVDRERAGNHRLGQLTKGGEEINHIDEVVANRAGNDRGRSPD